MNIARKSFVSAKRGQRGLSLMFALLALVSLSLAAIGLVRSVDTGVLVLGNIGFKQDATASADQGSRMALDKLKAVTDLNSDSSVSGYYATAHTGADITGQNTTIKGREQIDWDGSNCSGCIQPATAGSDVNHNQVKYVIFRLCKEPGDPETATNSCAQPLTSGTSANCMGRGEGDTCDSTATVPYYRVVVRTVIGANSGRETASFTETIVHF